MKLVWILLLTAILAPTCWAGPREEVVAAMAKSSAASSYHASMRSDAPTPMSGELFFVAPDRYRMRMQGIGEQTVIGPTLYMTLHGRTMKLPVPKSALGHWNALAEYGRKPTDIEVTALAPEPVAGAPARKYRVRYAAPREGAMTLWIGADGYPLQVRTDVGGHGAGATTIRYSRFNDLTIRVAAP